MSARAGRRLHRGLTCVRRWSWSGLPWPACAPLSNCGRRDTPVTHHRGRRETQAVQPSASVEGSAVRPRSRCHRRGVVRVWHFVSPASPMFGGNWAARRRPRILPRFAGLANGQVLAFDALVVATGLRHGACWGHATRGRHVVRTVDDAVSLRAALVPPCVRWSSAADSSAARSPRR